MCIKNVYHNIYVDGKKDVTERFDACRSGNICSDPIVREFDRKINCTRSQLTITDFRPDVPVTTANQLLGFDGGPHETNSTTEGHGPGSLRPDSRTPFAIPIHPNRGNYRSHSYSVDKPGQGLPQATTRSPLVLGSPYKDVSHSGVQPPPSRPGTSSERVKASDLYEALKLVQDCDDSSLYWVQGDVDIAQKVREGVRTEHEQDSGRYHIENDTRRQATFDAKLQEPTRRSEAKPEIGTGDFIREAQRIMRAIREKNDTAASDLDSVSDTSQNPDEKPGIRTEDFILEAQRIMREIRTKNGIVGSDLESVSDPSQGPSITDSQFADLPLRGDSPQFPLSSRRNQVSPPTDDYTYDYQWDDINSAAQLAVPPAITQSSARIYTPHLLSDFEELGRERFDDLPVDKHGEADFLHFPEVRSAHRSDSHDTNNIGPPKSLATTQPGTEHALGTAIVSMAEDDGAARHERRLRRAYKLTGQPDEEEAAAPVAWLGAQTASKNICSTSSAALDDASSIQSYNDSIFDDLESALSSVSSLGDNAQADFVSAFVDLLTRDPNVDRMIARATSDTGIGVERFRRSFSTILKVYSRDLREIMTQQQRKEHNHQRVAAFISRRTMQARASSLAATRYKERAPKPDNSALDKVAQYLDGLESDHGDSSDEEEAGTVPTVAGLETFLLQGKPFKALKWHLRSLIIPNQRVAQVKESAEHLLDFMFCDLGLEETFARANGRIPDFSTWLHLRIDVLAASLETELKARSPITGYLSIYSDYLSAAAVQKLGQKPDDSASQHSGSARQEQGKTYSTEIRPPEEILEDIMVARLPEVFGGEFCEPAAWSRLMSTKSFREFTSDLSGAAYSTFFSESRKALKVEIDSEVHGTPDQSEERHLLSILTEMQCSARQDRKFSVSMNSSESVLWFDLLKLLVEKSSGSEWSWWPLSPPPRAESPAHIQLEPLDMRQQLSRAASWLLPKCFVSLPISICNRNVRFSGILLGALEFAVCPVATQFAPCWKQRCRLLRLTVAGDILEGLRALYFEVYRNLVLVSSIT